MAESTRYSTLDNKTIELNNFVGRCGVVPYTITNTGRLGFAFGIDRKTGDITDWGGSRNPGESIHEAARRELTEESSGILNCGSVENCRVGHHGNAVTFFVKFDNITLLKVFPEAFHESKGSDEMKNVMIMSLADISRYLESGSFYSLVAEVLLTCMPHLYKIELETRTIFETQAVKRLI